MKKLLLLLTALFLAIMPSLAKEATATFDFTTSGANAQSGTDGSISYKTAKNNGTAEPTIMNSSYLRLYQDANGKGGSITLSGATMTKIVFTYNSSDASFQNSAASVGTLNNGTWTGSASSVTFTNDYTTKTRVDIETITVTYESDGEVIEPEPTPSDAIEDVLEIVANKFSGMSYTVPKDWTSTVSGAVYTAQASINSGFQIRTSQATGITVKSAPKGKKVKNIIINLASTNNGGDGVSVYAGTSAFSIPAKNSTPTGAALKTGIKGTDNEVKIDAPYFIIVPTSNEYCVVSSVTVNWVSADESGDDAVELTKFEFSAQEASWDLGASDNAALPTLTIEPSNADVKVTYTSSDNLVASVSEDGKVTPNSVGETTITATFAGNDEYKPATATYRLNVTDSTQPVDPTPGEDTGYDELTTGFFDMKGSGYSMYTKTSEGTKVTYKIKGSVSNGMQINGTTSSGNSVYSALASVVNEDLEIEKIVITGGTSTTTRKIQVQFGNTPAEVSAENEITPANMFVKPMTNTTESIEQNIAANEEVTFTPTKSAKFFRIGVTVANAFQMSSVKVYYKKAEADPNAVDTPVISFENNTVSITCETEGAQIYYTTDDSEPTKDSNEYKDGFTIEKTVTVKAIAINGDYSSKVASLRCIFMPEQPMTVAQAITLINDGYEGEATAKGIVSRVTNFSSSYGSVTYYISDDGTTNDDLQVYGGFGLEGAKFTSQDDVEVGANVVVKGSVKLYNGAPEFDANSIMLSYIVPAKKPAMPVVTLEDGTQLEDGESTTVIAGTIVTITCENATTVKGDFADQEFEGEVPYKLTINEDGDLYVTGYNGDLEGEMFTHAFVIGVPAPVFSVADGSKVSKGFEVTISCSDENATIYYRTDEEYEVYTPGSTHIHILEETLIEAYAKVGNKESEHILVAYEVFENDEAFEATATFNFHSEDAVKAMTDVEIEVPATTSNTGTNFDGITFTNEAGAKVTFTKGTAGTDPRWWNNEKNGLDCRIYNGSSMTLTAPENYVITVVEFRHDVTQNITWNTPTPDSGSFIEKKVWNGEGVEEVVFSFSGTGMFQYIDVTYERTNMRHLPAVPTSTNSGSQSAEIIIKNNHAYHDLYYRAYVYIVDFSNTPNNVRRKEVESANIVDINDGTWTKSQKDDDHPEVSSITGNDDGSVTHVFSTDELVKLGSGGEYESVGRLPADKGVKEGVLELQTVTHDPITNEVSKISYVDLNNEGGVSGVEDVVLEGDGEAVYYNLQGVRVSEPLAPGLYIRSEGNSTVKVYIR